MSGPWLGAQTSALASDNATVQFYIGANANDGIKPIDNVIKVGGTLYGMTVYGGSSGPSPDDPSVNGSGTVFALPLPD